MAGNGRFFHFLGTLAAGRAFLLGEIGKLLVKNGMSKPHTDFHRFLGVIAICGTVVLAATTSAYAQDGGTSGFSWQFFPPSDDGDSEEARTAWLLRGNRDASDADFYANCLTGSGSMTITLLRAQSDAGRGDDVTVELSANGESWTYDGAAGPAGEDAGDNTPWLTTTAGDPLWRAMEKGLNLTVTIDDGDPSTISLKGSAGPVADFADACAEDG